MQQRFDQRAALRAIDHALEVREMIEQVQRGDLGIQAELLRKIAQDAADVVFVVQDVDSVEDARSRSRLPEE